MSSRVLVVDDDQAIRDSLRRTLVFDGYEVEVATGGAKALSLLRERLADLVILDVNMPEIDGLEVARRLRKVADIPILMLTARDAPRDRVVGLDAGADDYLVKPFDSDELLARVRALLRRRHTLNHGDSQQRQFLDITMDLSAHEVTRAGERVDLSPRQFDLLHLFLRNPRHVLSREQILESVWSEDPEVSENVVDVYVGYLRERLEVGGKQRVIHTVRGVGFVLREQ